jgi:uncharacterized membrane protein
MVNPDDFDAASDRPGLWVAPPIPPTSAIATYGSAVGPSTSSRSIWRKPVLWIVLFIIVFIVVAIIIANRQQQAQLERDRLARQAEIQLENQRAAAKREAARQEDARQEAARQEDARQEAARQEAELALKRLFAPTPYQPTPNTIRVQLRNLCQTESLDVAIHYRFVDKTWVTAGWWNAKPEATIYPDVKTDNTVLYLYAFSKSYNWSGTDFSSTVVDEAFSYRNGKDPAGSNRRIVQMRRVDAHGGKFQFDLTCSN